MIQTENFDKIEVKSSKEIRNWLLKNHDNPASVWLVTFKKSESDNYISSSDVLDELLCFGWIDGIRRKLDDRRTMQLISQRKAEHWAKTYKERVQKLIDEGKMHQSGFNSIERAKNSGLWNYMDDVDALAVPTDLAMALNKIKGAADFFKKINPSSKHFVLRWLKLAKTEKTRDKRIHQLVDLSAKGEKLSGS